MGVTVAFVGNPNVGKSAWINALSHANFKVGNWAGVTVEKKEANVIWEGQHIHLIDLPGTYSLQESDNEEDITGRYLHAQHVDLIVNVLDATNLRQNLMLTLMLRELQIPMLLLFNFMDEVERYHIQIDIRKLSRRLQLDILPYSAFDKEHYLVVRNSIIAHLQQNALYYPLLSSDHQEVYVQLYNEVEKELPRSIVLEENQLHTLILGYMKQDRQSIVQMTAWYMDESKLEYIRGDINEQDIHQDYQHVITSLMKYVREDVNRRFEKSKKIDHILLHKIFGLPIFFMVFSFVLLFVFQFSQPWNDFINFLVNDILARYVGYGLAFAPVILQRFFLDAIVKGVGGVLVFVPIIACLSFMIAVLEESGYMARISFLLDRSMRVFHLSGKSFVALMLGFGCNVPAIYATRTLDHEKQRRLTAIIIPFMSCGARLPLYALFASAFFPRHAALMILSVYGIGLFMALLFALIFSKVSMMRDDEMYLQELPIYRLPSLRLITHKMKEEVKGYIKKATGIVLWAMIVLWSLSYFPSGVLQDSYIAQASRFVQPLFEPLGFGTRWESIAALPGGFIAKETIVGYFDQVLTPTSNSATYEIHPMNDIKDIATKFIQSGMESVRFLVPNYRDENNATSKQVRHMSTLWSDPYAKLRAFSFMVYVLLSIPCIMSLQALYHEYGYKVMLLSIATMSIVPYVVSLFIFQLFSRLMFVL